MPAYDSKELKVWQKSVSFVQTVYELTKSFPVEEKFGIVSQLRRSAISIAVDIAEGSGRSTDKDFPNFLSIAYGSSLEVETLLLQSNNFGYVSGKHFLETTNQLSEILRMLNGFSASLKS